MTTSIKTYSDRDLFAKAEAKAIEHVNYLVRERGCQWPFKKMEKAVDTWTQRMYENPTQYGIL